MVSNNAHGDIGILIFSILCAGQLANLIKHRLEDIGVVVRLFALNGAYQTLKAHTGINHFLRQWFERAVGFAIILHEDDVPNLNDLWMVFVHHLAAGDFGFFLFGAAVHVNLRAWTTRTCITHFPEVIVLITIDDMVSG